MLQDFSIQILRKTHTFSTNLVFRATSAIPVGKILILLQNNCFLSQNNCTRWFREPYSRTEKTPRKRMQPSLIVPFNAVIDEYERRAQTPTSLAHDLVNEFRRNIMNLYELRCDLWVLTWEKTLPTRRRLGVEPKTRCFRSFGCWRWWVLGSRRWCFKWLCDRESAEILLCHFCQLLSWFHHWTTFNSSKKKNEALSKTSFYERNYLYYNWKLRNSRSEKRNKTSF